MSRATTHNFAAGPSPLPTDVLEEASAGLLNYNGTGMGVCELSHRGKEFKSIIEGAEADIRSLLSIPENYAILFAQGGGTTQFSSVLLNLLAAHKLSNPTSTPPPIDYVVTGSWSSKAYTEAIRLSTLGDQIFATPRIAATSKSNKYTSLPTSDEYTFSKDAAYAYYCENETIHGAQFGNGTSFPFDKVPANVPIVADYSSSFLSRPIPNVERHAIIYAGAQKNLGPSGVTVVIVRKDLLVDTGEAMKLGGIPSVPIQNEYKTLADNGSLYNTPPVFPIYVSALVLKKLKAKGLDAVRATNEEKAKVLYEALERAEGRGVVKIVVKDGSRSWMNVTFTVEDEAKFLAGAAERKFEQLKGHRSVGGIRASLYNAVSLESVKLLAAYIDEYKP